MEATNNKLVTFYTNIKNNNVIKAISNTLSSKWGIFIMAFLTFLFHALKLEFVLYCIVGVYVVFVCLFCEDLLPVVSLFLFCYVSPSVNNNPGISETSIFYGNALIGMIVIIFVAFISIFLRIGFDKNMGYRKLFTKKRSLFWGMLALGVAYMISGIGSKFYNEVFLKNLLFAFLQFASIFLLYFIFSATIDWKKIPKDYFAYLGLSFGLIVVAEIFFAYLSAPVIQNGVINVGFIHTGWGMKNNIGAVVAFTIPFAFYLALKKRHTYIYFSLATIMIIATIMTGSRGSALVGLIAYIVCLVVVFFKAENKKWYRISCGVLALLALIIGLLFWKKIETLFSLIPGIVSNTDSGLVINDSTRFWHYENGWKGFLEFPILGRTFYPTGFSVYEFSTVEAFTGFFPPRWHNTIIQLLFSTGIVGMIAYSFHRLQTIKMLFKKSNWEKLFIACSIATLLAMSLLDCHFFNVGPTLFYSIFLMFAEFMESEDELKEEKIEDISNEQNKEEILETETLEEVVNTKPKPSSRKKTKPKPSSRKKTKPKPTT